MDSVVVGELSVFFFLFSECFRTSRSTMSYFVFFWARIEKIPNVATSGQKVPPHSMQAELSFFCFFLSLSLSFSRFTSLASLLQTLCLDFPQSSLPHDLFDSAHRLPMLVYMLMLDILTTRSKQHLWWQQ